METRNFCELFSTNKTEMMSITSLAEWRQAEKGSRLLLPPIQRSVVWSNEQIINYWDSLLRGYSAGMMMVHPVRPGDDGRDENGATHQAGERDFQLFDGQQRMAAVLLGLGKGQMKDARRLWVDLGKEPNKSSGLKFQLRMTSTGQPFGYNPDAPNQKIELRKRQEAWDRWSKEHTNQDAQQQAFANVTCDDIIDAKCATPLAVIYGLLNEHKDCDLVIKELSKSEGASEEIVHDFIRQIDMALKSEVIIQLVASNVVGDEEEYIRFFKRLGQGGTRLSDDELTYSIIKHQFPWIHDRMQEIMRESGRLAGEVDLVLAALRVAKTVAPWPGAKEWEVISRPAPAFVAGLKDNTHVRTEFLRMISQEGGNGKLQNALGKIRAALSFHKEGRPNGLPVLLLARLPKELIDVLILFVVKLDVDADWHADVPEILSAFVMHWLLFVRNSAKAASRAFQHSTSKEWAFNATSIQKLVAEYEREAEASFIPRRAALCNLRNEVQGRDHIIPPWAERFIAADHTSESKPGEALRFLSTNRELCMRALMWLQRAYIAKHWPSFDPTSDRDEDLPIDLDHIVPRNIFAFDWRVANSRLEEEVAADQSWNFYNRRSIIGDSIGNFRWLDASKNRERGAGAYGPLPCNQDLVSTPEAWNKIIQGNICNQKWSNNSIATFQRLIDLRTLDLYETILTKSGIERILPEAPDLN
jgi:hypothetical protein